MRSRLVVLSLFAVLIGAYGYFHFAAARRSLRPAEPIAPAARTQMTTPRREKPQSDSRKPKQSAQTENDILSKAIVLPPAPIPQAPEPLRP
jgi:hypothetical protein